MGLLPEDGKVDVIGNARRTLRGRLETLENRMEEAFESLKALAPVCLFFSIVNQFDL